MAKAPKEARMLPPLADDVHKVKALIVNRAGLTPHVSRETVAAVAHLLGQSAETVKLKRELAAEVRYTASLERRLAKLEREQKVLRLKHEALLQKEKAARETARKAKQALAAEKKAHKAKKDKGSEL